MHLSINRIACCALIITVFLTTPLIVSAKKSVAVLPSGYCDNITLNAVVSELIKTNEYKVIDRQEIVRLLAEQNLGTSLRTEQESVGYLSKIKDIDGIFFISEHSGYDAWGKYSVELSGKLVDLRTSEILWVDQTKAKIYFFGSTEKKAAKKLMKEFKKSNY